MIMLILAAAATVLMVRLRWYRLDAAPRRLRVVGPLLALVFLVGVFLLQGLGVSTAATWMGLDSPVTDLASLPPEHQTWLTLGAYAGQSIVLLVYLSLLLRAEPLEPDDRPGMVTAILRGVGSVLLWWPLATACLVVVLHGASLFGYEPEDPIAHETLRMIMDGEGWAAVTSALLAVLAAPVLEELTYRGLLQDALVRLKCGRWPAIICASVLFTAMHGTAVEPHALAAIFVISLGFGWIYERTGRLSASMVMHVLFNAGNLALAPLAVA